MDPKNKLPPWLRPEKLPTELTLQVEWYTQDNWMKVKESSVDPDRFENTYEEWLEMAEEALSDMKAAGLKVDRALINAEELLAWCIAHNKINDAASRSEFVAQHGAKALDTDA